MIALLRRLPTLPLFSILWHMFLGTLQRRTEIALKDWLRGYERPLPSSLRDKHGSDEKSSTYVSFWSGIDGIVAGSGSGSEPAEALHASWQRELDSLGGKGDVPQVLQCMQTLHSRHWTAWFEWDSSDTLSFTPATQDPALIKGAALRRAGRTTATEFTRVTPQDVFISHAEGSTIWIAMAATAQDLPLNQQSAALGLQMLRSTREALRCLIKRAGLLDNQTDLDFAVTQHFFDSIAYVRCNRRGWRCTCLASAVSAVHTQCEHISFCKSLTLAGRPAELVLDKIPQHKRRGGRPKSAAEPPRKRRRLGTAARRRALNTKSRLLELP